MDLAENEYLTLYKNYNEETLKEAEAIQYSHLTTKERKATIVPVRNYPKISRNKPCPCGSGKKYKKCCGKNQIGG